MALLDAFLYGRLYLPNSTLEALYLRRLTPRSQLKISCVSDPRLPNGGSILALLQYDAARYSTEYIYSTDSSLIGVRGLYNFGPAPSPPSYPPLPLPLPLPSSPLPPTITPQLTPPPTSIPSPSPSSPSSQQPPRPHPHPHPLHGLFSAGAELYYSPINKSSGMSCGLRFATLPAHAGFPYTMTLTLNPLMGNLSSTYSVVASRALTLSSCFDFNFYSYESELKVGMELWRKKRVSASSSSLLPPPLKEKENNTTNTNDHTTPPPPPRPPPPPPSLHPQLQPPPSLSPQPQPQPQPKPQPTPESPFESGILKARLNNHGAVSLLWESRAKDLLYSCGVVLDPRRGEGMVRSIGIEISYSS